jgi:hypothetical protein
MPGVVTKFDQAIRQSGEAHAGKGCPVPSLESRVSRRMAIAWPLVNKKRASSVLGPVRRGMPRVAEGPFHLARRIPFGDGQQRQRTKVHDRSVRLALLP